MLLSPFMYSEKDSLRRFLRLLLMESTIKFDDCFDTEPERLTRPNQMIYFGNCASYDGLQRFYIFMEALTDFPQDCVAYIVAKRIHIWRGYKSIHFA